MPQAASLQVGEAAPGGQSCARRLHPAALQVDAAWRRPFTRAAAGSAWAAGTAALGLHGSLACRSSTGCARRHFRVNEHRPRTTPVRSEDIVMVPPVYSSRISILKLLIHQFAPQVPTEHQRKCSGGGAAAPQTREWRAVYRGHSEGEVHSVEPHEAEPGRKRWEGVKRGLNFPTAGSAQ